ncbi:MAG: hypothetical protein DI586_08525 [Micavibrio aeruginosavorus]|uniref:Lysylphosphatidylglycerol synthetase family protein n=1 Tax=Micavibrio aeruginosavorus TaxID=349221 RepID=A0A2W5H9Z2_9BACT|nr:MAG: hypothetical protein DI586_08525 [Micavibrio aeruginosavorus]
MNFFRTFWSRHKLAIKLCLAAAIIAIILFRMDWAHVAQLAANIRIEYFFSAMALIGVQVLFLALRWQYFMNAEETLVNYRTALNVSVASQLANFVFITSVGGVFVRLYLARHYGLSILKSLCAVIADRFMTFFAMLFFAVVFSPILTDLVPGDNIQATLIELCIALLLCGVFGLIGLKFLKPYIRKSDALYSSFLYLLRILKNRPVAIKIVLSSLAAQASFFIAGCLAAKAIGLEINWIEFMAMLPFISIASSLPVGFGGWGIREGAFIVALGFLHIPMESAFLISVQVGILSILGTILIALPLAFTGDLQKLLKLSRKGAAKNDV